MSESPALLIENLEFKLKNKPLLQALSLEVAQGTTLAVLGHNGAGKTTLFHLILGLKFPDRGTIQIFGQSQLNTAARQSIGYVPERAYLNLELRFRSFLVFHARLMGLPEVQVNGEVIRVAREVGLEGNLEQAFKTFSKGMLQKAMLAQASLGNPKLLILDEPMSGLDPEAREGVKARIRAWKQEGRAVIFSSHVLEDVSELADQVMILKSGMLDFQGKIEEWRLRP